MLQQTFVARSRCIRIIIMNTKNSSDLGDDNTSFIEPEFLRVKDVEKMFGLKRGKLYALIREGAVISKSLRTRGTIRGVRLVSVDSLRNYINSQGQ